MLKISAIGKGKISVGSKVIEAAPQYYPMVGKPGTGPAQGGARPYFGGPGGSGNKTSINAKVTWSGQLMNIDTEDGGIVLTLTPQQMKELESQWEVSFVSSINRSGGGSAPGTPAPAPDMI